MSWTLIPVSAAYGAIAVLVFRRLGDRAAMGRSFDRSVAHVMEFALYLDTPSLVWRAQLDLLRENARLLRLVMAPAGIMAALFALVYWPMQAIYGYEALVVGAPAVVTIQMKDSPMPAVQLEAPLGVAVETPAVHVPQDRQISWRVRPLREATGDLVFRVDRRVVRASMDGFFFPDAEIRSVDLRRPEARVLGLPWMFCFAAIAMGSGAILELLWKR